MPWRCVRVKDSRREFVTLAETHTVVFGDLCRRFGISRPTGYKWVQRYRQGGEAGLEDRSRRPHRVVHPVPAATEDSVVALRRRHPAWGSRKIRKRLPDALAPLPACSTITAILHRHHLIAPEGPGGRRDWNRFEHPVPNALWQMDFKGPISTMDGPVHPLTVLDDHSRYNLGLQALTNRQTLAVRQTLTGIFRHYGLPDVILVDNGSPWGNDAEHPHTPLTVWLMHLGVGVSNSRPYHPQTLGKDERFHRTLKQEVVNGRQWRHREHLQQALDTWRVEYNFQRPHEALGMDVPASRYRPSLRTFPETLPSIDYPAGVAVRRVQQAGQVCFEGRTIRISKAFRGYPVGFRPAKEEGTFEVLFRHHIIARVTLGPKE